MLVTFVVRLVPDRLRHGEMVGEVEHVGDGGHAIVRGTSDLLGFAERVARAGSDPDPGADEGMNEDQQEARGT